jgi:hypothetical protein
MKDGKPSRFHHNRGRGCYAVKKKLLLLGTGFTLGSALLVTSAFAGVGDAPGYDAYKAAIKSTLSAQSLTENVNVTVEDNGSQLLSVKSAAKTDKANRTASADVAIQGGSAGGSVQLYRQDGQQIVKTSDSDVYNVYGKAGRKDRGHKEKADEAWNTEMENVADALVGNLKNYVTLNTQADGTKQIGLQLNGSQIPSVAKALSSIFIKQAVNNNEHANKIQNSPFGTELQQVRASLPKLTQDIQIQEADLNATVDSQNRITDQKVKVMLSGKDDQGTNHQVVISADIALSGFNSTTPDKVDLTGKQVKTVEKQRGNHEE